MEVKVMLKNSHATRPPSRCARDFAPCHGPGVDRQQIFHDAQDREDWLERVAAWATAEAWHGREKEPDLYL